MKKTRTWHEQSSPPWRYAKAGVVTVDLVPLAVSQRALIGRLDCDGAGRLMGAMDACNARFGRGSVVPTRAGLAQQRRAWTTKFEMHTPRYTTQVDALPVARVGMVPTLGHRPELHVRASACHL